MKYKCYIVDDEPLAIKVIEQYLSRLEKFEVVGTETEPVKAFSFLRQNPIDLLFLDIEMPNLKGLDLLKALSSRPEVIVTTAYRDYAVEGFELDLLDYLVKPIPYDRFLIAIDRFLERRESNQPASDKDHIFVRADRKEVKVNFDDILYVQGVKDYVKIVSGQGNVLTKTSLGPFYDRLPKLQFIRIHKSYVVNRSKITAITRHDVEIGDTELPIGASYRSTVLAAINKV